LGGILETEEGHIMNNDDAYALIITYIAMIIFGTIIAIFAVIAICNGVTTAQGIDNTTCSDVIVEDTYITRTTDGFLGMKNDYFIVTSNGDYELLTNANMTAVQMWNHIELGSTQKLRTYGKSFVFCDQPKLLEGFNKVVKGTLS
jgi:hypothetical protein